MPFVDHLGSANPAIDIADARMHFEQDVAIGVTDEPIIRALKPW